MHVGSNPSQGELFLQQINQTLGACNLNSGFISAESDRWSSVQRDHKMISAKCLSYYLCNIQLKECKLTYQEYINYL